MDKKLIEFAKQLAKSSGDVIKQGFRCTKNLSIKNDGSPVTEIDTKAEQAMITLIKEHYPDHGIIAEESGTYQEEAEYQWILDPIDGTKSFMIGKPIFGTLIALAKGDQFILGIIYQPITEELWLGIKGEGCFLNGQPIHARANVALEEAVICTTGPEYLTTVQFDLFKEISGLAAHTAYGGDCYNYALLATGFVDVILEAGLKLHDYAALVPIVTEAGGKVTDWQGKELTLKNGGSIIAASSRDLHLDILDIVKMP